MAEPSYDFTKRTAERIVRAVREVESKARERRRHPGPDQFGEEPPIPFRNDSASAADTMPPFGVGAIVGCTEYNGFPLLIVEKPTSSVAPAYLANSNLAVPTSGHGFGYVSGILTAQYSTPPTTAYQTYGPTSGSWALGTGSTIPVAKAIGILNSSTVTGYTTGPTMQAYWLTPSSGGGADVKLAVSDQNVGMYATTLFTPFNSSTEYRSEKDMAVDFEPVGTTPNQMIRGFVDTDAIPGYDFGAAQYLTKDSSDKLAWSSGLAVTSVDEKLAATSENSGVYWDGLHFDYNASTVFNSTQDLKIESEVTGTTPNQDIRLYADMSDIANWTGAGHQFFMTGANADLVWRNAENINVTTVYNASQDLLVEPELNGANIFFFSDMSGVSGYSASEEQYLTNSSGVTKWTSGTAGKDEKLAVTSENGGDYWDQLHNEYNASPTLSTSLDLLIYSEAAGSTPNQTIRLYADLSLVSGYVATNVQFLHHSSAGVLSWVNATTCT